MTATQNPPNGFFNRHDWKILLVISVIFGLFGLGDLIQGMDADTAIAESIIGVAWEDLQETNLEVARLIHLQVRAGGAQLILVSVLSIAVCLVGYRRAERWAWYTFWLFPAWMISIFVLFFSAERHPDMPPPPPMLSAPIFCLLAMLVLLIGLTFIGGRPSLPTHTGLGHGLGLFALLLLILAYIGRLPDPMKRDTWFSFGIYILLADVVIFLRGSLPEIAALHPVLALILFALVSSLALRAWRLCRATAVKQSTAVMTQVSRDAA